MKHSRRTPEGFDLNPGRVMPYRGRVDDPFGFGWSRRRCKGHVLPDLAGGRYHLAELITRDTP